jgi:hypothetical protein
MCHLRAVQQLSQVGHFPSKAAIDAEGLDWAFAGPCPALNSFYLTIECLCYLSGGHRSRQLGEVRITHFSPLWVIEGDTNFMHAKEGKR